METPLFSDLIYYGKTWVFISYQRETILCPFVDLHIYFNFSPLLGSHCFQFLPKKQIFSERFGLADMAKLLNLGKSDVWNQQTEFLEQPQGSYQIGFIRA